MCYCSRTVAQNAFTSNALPQAPPPLHGADEMGEGVFLCPMAGQCLVLVARVSASVAFFHAGCRLERTTARYAVETRKRGVRLPRFQLQSKGEGRALRPRYEKSGGLFFKSPRLSCETRGLLCKTPPFFGACLQRADERSLPAFHTRRGERSPRADCLTFPRPRNLQRP